MQLGDYVKLIVLCAVLLPVIALVLASTNSIWTRRLGKIVGGVGMVAGILLALLIAFVVVISVWLADQMANQ